MTERFVAYADALNELALEVSEIAESKGFWDLEGVGENALIPLKLALVNTEVAEALEAHRKGYDDDDPSHFSGMTPLQEEDFTEEVADAVIRLFDIIGFYGLSEFGNILVAKIEKNRTRPYLHGKRY